MPSSSPAAAARGVAGSGLKVLGVTVLTSLTAEDLARIEAVFPKGAAQGTRYPEAGMKAVNR